MQSAERALSTISTFIRRAGQLRHALGDNTLGGAERAVLLTEVNDLRRQMIETVRDARSSSESLFDRGYELALPPDPADRILLRLRNPVRLREAMRPIEWPVDRSDAAQRLATLDAAREELGAFAVELEQARDRLGGLAHERSSGGRQVGASGSAEDAAARVRILLTEDAGAAVRTQAQQDPARASRLLEA